MPGSVLFNAGIKGTSNYVSAPRYGGTSDDRDIEVPLNGQENSNSKGSSSVSASSDFSFKDSFSNFLLSPEAFLESLLAGDFGMDSFKFRLALLKGDESAKSVYSFSQNLSSLKKPDNTPDEKLNTATDMQALISAGYNPQFANHFANIAKRNAERKDTRGLCLQGFREAAEAAKLLSKTGAGALGSAAKNSVVNLDNDPTFRAHFKKIEYKGDMSKLPAGCVIVTDDYTDNSGKYHQYGHIEVSLGNGQGASDFVGTTKNRNVRQTVYLPIG